MLDVTGLKRSYWDKYKNYSISHKDNESLKNIVKVYEENLKQFGYRRITKYLKEDYEIIYNAKKVLRIMNENNIQAEYVKRIRRKILIKQTKNKNIIKYPDLVNRKFNSIKEKFKVLFTDVTYLIWNGKKHYQSTIIDGHTKEIVDVQWSKYNDNKIVMNNLDAAINKIKETKKDLSDIIIHSDHGFQYTSKIYNNKCISNGIRISMGKNYHCADNIVIESFHSLLKKATIHNNIYLSHDKYINDVKKWNKWYSSRKEKDIINKSL
ncbi:MULTISPECIES: IS3 family transposase [Spiroplasma]|uniref:IS3 family transposase n=1 Tax=Spiroplasma TaxID=2132 RepID=UPI0018DD7FC4|nr:MULTISPECIES: IS3 family transposase [Spiroplasma]MBH8623199.1 IS3 family transposase [Spiroplasma sp. hyd1]UNF62650.1 IS3 family transposase [Spiroplasma poulsonii]